MSNKKIKREKQKVNFYQIEQEILKFWEENDILNKSIDVRPNDKVKTFYDGPITANGDPHHGHMLTFAIKDLIPRYWTMKGYKVERSLGWDCQGLPVEIEVEKIHQFKEKKDIERYGVAKFNEDCRNLVLKYRAGIVELEKKMGRLTNDREEYATMDKGYIESIWWSLKELYNKGLLYEGFKVVPYSTRGGTVLSNAEVALGGYKPVVDPAVTVKFKIKDRDNEYILAWTTTPWTLPTNFALAVGENITYSKVHSDGENFYVANELIEKVFADRKYHVLDADVSPETLVDLEYEPLFDYFIGRENCFKVVYGFHVTTESGTGVVHLAPYGAEDNEIFNQIGIKSIDVLDDQGDFLDVIKDFAGMNYRDANPKIVEYLKNKNLLFKYEDYEHDMPICWRTNTPLIYKPITSWYIAVSKIRDKLVENNRRINWIPEHIKEGRFGNWLAEIKDWSISRFRYWGTPLPIWKSPSGKVMVIGSYEELEKLSGKRIDDPHRPYIDEITFEYEGETYTRIPDVLDVWYDSGAMPFARFHYPFENKEKFEQKYPAQFISEGVDQTRGWFYTLHAIGTALFGKEAFENVVVNGLVLDDNGQKLSKSKKNYTDPLVMIQNYGGDTMRINFFSTPIVRCEDATISDKTARTIQQEFLIPFWNIYVYLTTYAELNNWTPEPNFYKNYELKSKYNILDRWVVERLKQTAIEVTKYMDNYDIQKSMETVKAFFLDISKWFIRRSRDRFANGEKDALETLYYVFTKGILLLAPFAPFLPEYMYQNIVRPFIADAKESIHMEDYPDFDAYDSSLIENMDMTRDICTFGLFIRSENGIKVKQPLSRLVVVFKSDRTLGQEYLEVVKDEVNVKEVRVENHEIQNMPSTENDYCVVYLDTDINDELRKEGLYAELKRELQVLRKQNGMQMGQMIKIFLDTDSDVVKALVHEFTDKLKAEVFIKEIVMTNLDAGSFSIEVDDHTVQVRMESL